MNQDEETPQGWQRDGSLLYTAQEYTLPFSKKRSWFNRLTVKIDGHSSYVDETEKLRLAERLHAFLSAPAALPLLGSGDAPAEAFSRALAKAPANAPEFAQAYLDAYLEENLELDYEGGWSNDAVKRFFVAGWAGAAEILVHPNPEGDCGEPMSGHAMAHWFGKDAAALSAVASTGGGAAPLNANKVADWLLDHGRSLFDNVHDGEGAKKVAAFAFAESLIESCAAAPQHLVGEAAAGQWVPAHEAQSGVTRKGLIPDEHSENGWTIADVRHAGGRWELDGTIAWVDVRYVLIEAELPAFPASPFAPADEAR